MTDLDSTAAGLQTDTEIWASIERERERQERQLELIASENHTSREVMAAMGTCLTNKYAEGYPGRRYYGGCEFVDEVENLARDRAKQLFEARYANVQPHSGTQANLAAMMALAAPGDRVLALSLDHGGHLSHGHPRNFSGVFYEFHSYGVDRDSERIEMDEVARLAREVRPKVLIVGTSAYSRTLDFAGFRAVADDVGAYLLADQAHIAGLVAAGQHPSPVPHAHLVTMTTHKTLRGPRGGLIVTNELEWLKSVNSGVFPGGQGGPLMHIIAAKAVALREALTPEFVTYQQQVIRNAAVLAESLAARGLRIVSGGTDNHLLLVDVGSFGMTGRRAENLLHEVDLTCNMNLIPYDERPAMETSGIRLGTAAVTTRGMAEDEMRRLAEWIADRLEAPDDVERARRIRDEIRQVTEAFPIYG